jgi:tetratricopeptide (TPR) repeat protein
MRASIPLVLLISLMGRAPAEGAQQSSPDAASSPPTISTPASLRGTDIDRALRTRDWDRAEQLLVGEIGKKPGSPELLTLLGRVFLMDRKPLNAAIAIKKAEALGPIDEGTRYALALAYISLKRGDWARPELERLAAASASNVLYQYWLGRLDYDAAQYGSAIRRFEQVIARDPTFMRAYDNLGLSYEALNDPERAIPQYRRAIELNRQASSRSPWPPLNLGILLRSRGELDEAEALLREALAYDTACAQAHYQLGAVLEQQGRIEQAVSQLALAVSHDARYAAPHYALARIYRRQGRLAEAGEALTTFQRLHDAQREGRP